MKRIRIRIILLTAIVGGLAAVFGFGQTPARAEDPVPCELGDLLIDDFTTGKYHKVVDSGDKKLKVKNGSMIGGSRRTNFIVGANPPNKYELPAELIIRDGVLIVNNGIRGFHRLEVAYGSEADLNLDLSHCDRFRVNYDANDLNVNFNLTVYSTDKSKRANISHHQGRVIIPGSEDFLFEDFQSIGGFDFAVDDVDIILLIFQSGSSIGANDYAVTSVLATSP